MTGTTAALCAAGALLGVIAIAQALPSEVLSQWGHSAVYISKPGALRACAWMLVIAAWGISVQFRCSDSVVRHLLLVVCALLVSWLAIHALKRATTSPIMTRACWYLYYFAMVGVPLCLFGCGLRVERPGASGIGGRVWWAAVAASVVAIALVLTNDLHQLVFRFDAADERWSNEYTYGPGYVFVVGLMALMIVGFIGMLLHGSKRQGRLQMAPLLIIAGVIATYCTAYVMRVPFVFASDFSTTASLLTAVGIEVCLGFGLLPSCAWYGAIFRQGGIDIRILPDDLSAPIESEVASPMPEEVGRLVREHDRPDGTSLRFAGGVAAGDDGATAEGDLLWDAYRIRGGWSVYAGDVSQVRRLRAELAERSGQLERSMRLRRDDLEVRRTICRQETQEQLLSEVEASISSATARIADMLASLPAASTPEGLVERRRALIRMKLLVGYCKRKGSLAITSQDTGLVEVARMRLMLDEAASDFGTAGVECASLVDLAQPVSAAQAIQVADLLRHLIGMAIDLSRPVLMLHLEQGPAEKVGAVARLGVPPLSVGVMLAWDEAGRSPSDDDLRPLGDLLREAAPECQGPVLGKGSLSLTATLVATALAAGDVPTPTAEGGDHHAA